MLRRGVGRLAVQGDSSATKLGYLLYWPKGGSNGEVVS